MWCRSVCRQGRLLFQSLHLRSGRLQPLRHLSHGEQQPKPQTQGQNLPKEIVSDTVVGDANHHHQQQQQQDSRGFLTWKSMLIQAALLGTVGTATYLYFDREKKIRLAQTSTVQSTGAPKLGGDWELTSAQTEARMTNKDLFGKYVLMYFGFTMCPDVCPTEMDKMSYAVERLQQRYGLNAVVPVFVSVDPKRDTPERIRDYLQDFHKTFLGFTGSLDDIRAITRKFRVYWSAPDDTADDDYVVDHSIIMYLIDPQGEFIDYYGKNTTADEVVQKITQHMERRRMQLGTSTTTTPAAATTAPLSTGARS